MKCRPVTDTRQSDAINEAKKDGCDLPENPKVYWLGEGDLYAVEDNNDYVFIELGAGVFVPEHRDECLSAIADAIAATE